MIWDRPWKKRKYYNNSSGQYQGYSNDYNWTNYSGVRRSRSGGWGEDPRRKKRGTLFKIGMALTILAMLVGLRSIDHPVGEELRVGLRYVLTTDWNFQPVVEKVVQHGLQLVSTDDRIDNGSPLTGIPTMGQGFSEGLVIPVSGKVVRGYGMNKDPLDNLERFHPGIDIGAAPGSPVKAVLSGKIVRVGEDPSLGRYVQVDHGQGTFTLYAGLAAIRVSPEQSVAAGEIIGEVAKNSDVKDGGLHFELREQGKLVDPLTRMDFPPVK